MADQEQSERFKAEMPQIPGVAAEEAPRARKGLAENPAVRLIAGMLVLLVSCLWVRVGSFTPNAPRL